MEKVSIVYGYSFDFSSVPLIIALLFGLAGAFFLALYYLHRIRLRKSDEEILKQHLRVQQ